MTFRVSLDFETFSESDIKKVGAWRYAEHPSTEVLCAAIAPADDPTAEPHLWFPGQPFPAMLEYADEIHAWNAEFEYAVMLRVCERRYGWPAPIAEQMRCSMALALSFGLPGKLEKAAMALRVDQQKDNRGSYLINKLCKPRRPSKTNRAERWLPATAPQDFVDLYHYCEQDVRAERAIRFALPRPHLPEIEQRTYLETLKSNARGVMIDAHSVVSTIHAAERYCARLEREHEEITGLRSGQLQAVKEWLHAKSATMRVELPDMKGETIERVLGQMGIDATCRRVLELRTSLGQTSIKKLHAMERSACRDGRIHGMLQYHGAGTGRWAGRLVQLQNLKKPAKELGKLKMHDWIEYAGAFDPGVLELFGDPMAFFTAFVRPCLISSPGKELIVADFNAIECRVLAWLSDERWLIELFKQNGDVYVVVASALFGYPVTKEQNPKERETGKRIELGCGYQMGARKFAETSKKYGAPITSDFAEQAVQAYRSTHRRVEQFWYDMQGAAVHAIRNPGLEVRVRHIGFRRSKQTLQMKLPSGRLLTYWNPRLEQGLWGPRICYEGLNSLTKQWGPQETYGGRLVENATQAVARDLCRDAIIRIADANVGYDYLFSSHDEIVSEVAWLNANEDKYCELMAQVPAWAAGCPIAAEGWVGKRYRK